MRIWLARWLHRLADWLTPPPDVVFLEEVGRLIAEADRSAPGTSGEYKRHVVYAALQKSFPDTPKRRLGMAIETVLSS